MEASRYQVTQDGKEYILTTVILNDKIRIECQDNNFSPIPTYFRDYSLKDLSSFSEIFTLIPTIVEAQNVLNNAIEKQQVKLANKGELFEITFNVQVSSYEQELTFQLPMKSTANIPTTNIPNLKPPVISPVEDEDYPDCTYSTRAPVPVQVPMKVPVQVPIQVPVSVPVPEQVYQTTEVNYEYPLDHDRINKIENNSNLLKGDHDQLRQRLNNLKMKIQMIKKQTSEIRKENGVLNMKTLELKKQYNNLIEAEGALRTENDDLRREKHELILKKNELGFYISEPKTYDSVKEVNIPIDGKRRRPTNVSKKEKQFGGGYTSSLHYKSTSKDEGYTSDHGRIYPNKGYYK